MATRESRVLSFLFGITLLTPVKDLDRTGLRPGRSDAYRTTYQWHLSYVKKDHPLLRITLSNITCDNSTTNVVPSGGFWSVQGRCRVKQRLLHPVLTSSTGPQPLPCGPKSVNASTQIKASTASEEGNAISLVATMRPPASHGF